MNPIFSRNGLYDVCESLFFLVDRRGEGLDSGRSPAVVMRQGPQVKSIEAIEPQSVDPFQFQRVAGHAQGNVPARFNFCEIPYTPQ